MITQQFDIDAEIEGYNSILVAEAEAVRSVASAKDLVEFKRAVYVTDGYATGAIAGKNADERERAEAIYLHDCGPYQVVLGLLQEAEHKLALARADRLATEAEIGLIKAMLYSQARIG